MRKAGGFLGTGPRLVIISSSRAHRVSIRALFSDRLQRKENPSVYDHPSASFPGGLRILTRFVMDEAYSCGYSPGISPGSLPVKKKAALRTGRPRNNPRPFFPFAEVLPDTSVRTRPPFQVDITVAGQSPDLTELSLAIRPLKNLSE